MTTTKAAHTAGPWTVGPATTWHKAFGFSIHAPKRGIIARVWKWVSMDDPESEANARLIAAAPEMLAALNQIAEGEFEDEGHAVGIARAAIAKATGGE